MNTRSNISIWEYAHQELDLARRLNLKGAIGENWGTAIFGGLGSLKCFRDMTVDTPTGVDCRRAIDRAKGLLDKLDADIPGAATIVGTQPDMGDPTKDFRHEMMNAIITATNSICETYIYSWHVAEQMRRLSETAEEMVSDALADIYQQHLPGKGKR